MPVFTASDGARIAFDDEGEGRPLLLLHGFMAHRGFFREQRRLAERFRLVSVDLRGHGQSREAGAVDVERLAEDVAGLVAELDLRDAVGVGWSLGAVLMWHLLSGPAADRFAGAVIVDMTPRVLNDAAWELGLSAEACAARRTAIEQDFPAFALAAGQAIFAQPVTEELQPVADWAGAEFARNDPAAMGPLWESLVAQDLRGRLAGIRQPTLIVHGAHSQLYGADTADYLVEALPDARAVTFGRSGHAPHVEQPDLFNRTIADFAASLPHVRAATPA